MAFEKIGKGEALVWMSGAAGFKAVVCLLAALLGWSYVIPEIMPGGFNPGRAVYAGFFIASLLVGYLLYRIGVAGEKPPKVINLWLSGFFGYAALASLIVALMSWTVVVPQAGVFLTAKDESTALQFAAMFVVEVLIALALWKRAKTPGHLFHAGRGLARLKLAKKKRK